MREEAVGVRAVWGVRVDAPVIVGVLWFTLSSQLHLCTPRPECDITFQAAQHPLPTRRVHGGGRSLPPHFREGGEGDTRPHESPFAGGLG